MNRTVPRRSGAGARRLRLGSALMLLIVAIALGLSACASQAPVEYLTLATLDPSPQRQRPASPAAAYIGPPIGVRAVHVPPAFDRIEIPLPTSGGRFIVAENRHWAAPLSRLAAQTLTEDLARQLPPASVLWPHLRWPAGHAEVTVDIVSIVLTSQGFEASFDWQMCESAAQGSSACRPVTVPGAGHETRFTSTAAGVAPGDVADRTARAVSEILARVAADICDSLAVPR